jgi:8-oxo-dGTP pyrophosphatase MutT (NUDIX family)
VGKNSQQKIKASKSPVVREFSAGGAVFKKTKNGYKWFLINPTGTDRWQLPKGHLDGKESSAQAAIREIAEEIGVKAKIIERLGVNKYFFVLKGQKIFKTVTFFLMEFANKVGVKQDGEVAEIRLVDYTKALELLTYKDDRTILSQGNAYLESETSNI